LCLPRPFASQHFVPDRTEGVYIAGFGKGQILALVGVHAQATHYFGTQVAKPAFGYTHAFPENRNSDVNSQNDDLKKLSLEMTIIGDLWRNFAVNASRVYKNRSNQNDVYNRLSNELLHIANLEEEFFKKLKNAIK
jgi:hypothetical protein